VQDIIGLTAMNGDGTAPATARLAELQDQIWQKETRATAVREELLALRDEMLGEKDVAAALSQFDPVWETLSTREKSRLLGLLIERVVYDGERGSVAITFLPGGIGALADSGGAEKERKPNGKRTHCRV
jgi:site-specific DNA recombinase